MKTLVIEDDGVSRLLLQGFLEPYGPVDTAADGALGVAAFTRALDAHKPYDLICLDIMMPVMDGHAALKRIRAIEAERNIRGLAGVKVIMITALSDVKNVIQCFSEQCEAYCVKPIDRNKFIQHLLELRLIPKATPGP